MREGNLDVAFKELTEIQRKAADWDEGPLLVLAGPGSGKTRVLTCRIARLLKQTPGDSFRILALTFTNKAADEMRQRIDLLANGGATRLFVGTFHSFCADVLRQHGVHLGIQPDFRIYGSDRDLARVMQDAVEAARSRNESVRESDTAFLPVIQRLKGEMIPPDRAAANVPEGGIRDRIEAVYTAYEEQLGKHNALDFSSLLYSACTLFERFPSFAKRYRSVYRFWCIDEFQDTNEAQFRLLDLMAAKSFHNIFVVADDDQIIYQWNGASYKRFEELRAQFSPEVIQLPTNYRCPPGVVELANRLIRNNVYRTADKKPLQAAREKDAKAKVISILHAKNETAEAAKIASTIAEQFAAELGKVVVLARTKRLLDLTKEALATKRINAVLLQRKDEFTSAAFTWMHACLRQASYIRDVENLRTLAASFFKLVGLEVDVEGIIARAEAETGNYFKEWLKDAARETPDQNIRSLLENANSDLAQSGNFQKFIEMSLKWFESLQLDKDDAFREDLACWNEIYPEILSALGDRPLLDPFLHELDLRSKAPTGKKDSVTLMTIHGAKGKEFDIVFLQGVAEDFIPSYQSKKKGPTSPEMEEERRNCFVAITRTKRRLILSYASEYFGWPKEPSRFFNEMGLEKYVASHASS